MATAKVFLQDVASRMRTRVQISTDGLAAYVDAIEQAFGGEVDYAQIIKTYGHEEVSDNRRYSAPEFVSSEKKVIAGHPDVDLISTSYVERLNATTRLHMRRLTRLTLAFSKKRGEFRGSGWTCTSPITTSSSGTIPCAALRQWPLVSRRHSGALLIW